MVQFQRAQFGEYVLQDRIGTGGMAEIFLATAQGVEGFEKRLVIKRILPSLSHDDQFVRMFIEEAKLCVALKHPNIVQVYDLGQEGSQYYIAMEYVDGRDLLKTLAACGRKKIGFPTDLALFITMEVLKGLGYAHGLTRRDGRPLGIIHRDVSPSNVFLSYSGAVKIGDFGIAKAATREKTATGILKGKFGYMAPEQVIGAKIDHRADVFASGILLYELLTGHRLFSGRNELKVLEKVRDARIEPRPREYRPDLSEELEGIVLRALARRTQDRFQSAGELHDVLHSYVQRANAVIDSVHLARFIQKLFLTDDEELDRRRRMHLPLPEGPKDDASAPRSVSAEGMVSAVHLREALDEPPGRQEPAPRDEPSTIHDTPSAKAQAQATASVLASQIAMISPEDDWETRSYVVFRDTNFQPRPEGRPISDHDATFEEFPSFVPSTESTEASNDDVPVDPTAVEFIHSFHHESTMDPVRTQPNLPEDGSNSSSVKPQADISSPQPDAAPDLREAIHRLRSRVRSISTNEATVDGSEDLRTRATYASSSVVLFSEIEGSSKETHPTRAKSTERLPSSARTEPLDAGRLDEKGASGLWGALSVLDSETPMATFQSALDESTEQRVDSKTEFRDLNAEDTPIRPRASLSSGSIGELIRPENSDEDPTMNEVPENTAALLAYGNHRGSPMSSNGVRVGSSSATNPIRFDEGAEDGSRSTVNSAGAGARTGSSSALRAYLDAGFAPDPLEEPTGDHPAMRPIIRPASGGPRPAARPDSQKTAGMAAASLQRFSSLRLRQEQALRALVKSARRVKERRRDPEHETPAPKRPKPRLTRSDIKKTYRLDRWAWVALLVALSFVSAVVITFLVRAS
jgi:serine/threonine protein kinase